MDGSNRWLRAGVYECIKRARGAWFVSEFVCREFVHRMGVKITRHEI